MRDLFLERRREFFIFIGLIIALILTVYFMFIFPKYKQIDNKKTSIQTMETEVSTLEKNIKKLEEEDEREDTFELRKKIPENDDMEKFLIDLEEIEGLSRSRVHNVEFDYVEGEDVLETSKEEVIITEEVDDEESDSKKKDADETEDEVEETETSGQSDGTEEESNLQNIQITLEVESPSYLSFILFIIELEQLERIMFVSELEFEQPAAQEWYYSEDIETGVLHEIELQTFTYKE